MSEKQEQPFEKRKQIAWLTEYLPPVLPIISTKKPAQDDNAMNKSVTNLWNVHKSTPASVASDPVPALEESASNQPETTVEEESNEKKSKKRSKSSKESGSSKRHKSIKKKKSVL